MGSDSDSHSDSSESVGKYKFKFGKKEKKEKKDKYKDKDSKKDKGKKDKHSSGQSSIITGFPSSPFNSGMYGGLSPEQMPEFGHHSRVGGITPTYPGFPVEQQPMHNRAPPTGIFGRRPSPSPISIPTEQQQHHQRPPSAEPPTYQSATPPSGYRLALAANAHFPPVEQSGPPPFYDADGVSQVFVGSALLDGSVHPCKISPGLVPPCRVPFGSSEYSHYGRFDLLPITDAMEWVITSGGEIPAGRSPIDGGYEENGEKLYHAAAIINGVEVPGKTGRHLGGANVAFGGREHVVTRQYKILCWR